MYRIGQEEIAELSKVISARDLFKVNQGLKESEQVETKLKKIFETDFPIFMTSGHAALTSALVAMGIGPGDAQMMTGSSGSMPILYQTRTSLYGTSNWPSLLTILICRHPLPLNFHQRMLLSCRLDHAAAGTPISASWSPPAVGCT